MPASLLSRLGVVPFSTRAFLLANGTRIERDFGQTWVRLDGEHAISPVVFGDEGAMPLLGALTLEVFSLGIDPVNQRLIPVDSLML
jgi:predicted aspartyl protease